MLNSKLHAVLNELVHLQHSNYRIVEMTLTLEGSNGSRSDPGSHFSQGRSLIFNRSRGAACSRTSMYAFQEWFVENAVLILSREPRVEMTPSSPHVCEWLKQGDSTVLNVVYHKIQSHSIVFLDTFKIQETLQTS